MPLLNENLLGFACIRCGKTYPAGDYATGCPHCFEAGFPASLRARYKSAMNRVAPSHCRGMLRFGDCLPYRSFSTLGEGDTPLLEHTGLAASLKLAAFYVKCEYQNPTGSHKDRMSCLAVARAADIGAQTVVAASSGNAGVSLAAYAAAANLRCIVVSTPSLHPYHRHLLEASGAELVTVAQALERWRYVAAQVRDQGWFSATNFLEPPVGSNFWGVDGYKTVAFEMMEAMGPEAPDYVAVPTARGDLLWGIFEGYRSLRKNGQIRTLPKLVAVEPHDRLARVLDGEDYRGAFPGSTGLVSIAGSTATWQSVAALRGTKGIAVAVEEAEVRHDRKQLATMGLHLELSAAAAFTAVRRLRADERIPAGSRVAMIATARSVIDTPP